MLNINSVYIPRNERIDFSKKIYFSKHENAWLITDRDLVIEMGKSEFFSSDRLTKKLTDSEIDEDLKKELTNFFGQWIMYQDSAKHQASRSQEKDMISQIIKQFPQESFDLLLQNFQQEVKSPNTIDLSIVIHKLAQQLMATIFGLKYEDYSKILALAKPTTAIMHQNLLSNAEAKEALRSIKNVQEFLNEITYKSHSAIYTMVYSEMPIDLIINILIDGQDPLESFLKSIGFVWGTEGLTDIKYDLNRILKKLAPFTSISRIVKDDVEWGNEQLHRGDRVLGILVNPNVTEGCSIAFGSGSHRCLGEALAMKIGRQFYEVIEKLKVSKKIIDCSTTQSFDYFSFTKMTMSNQNNSPVVFDLDGTITFDGKTVLPEIKQALIKASDYKTIIFASARPIRDMTSILKEFENNIWIGGNGSIVKQNNQIQVQNVIGASDFELIKSIISNYEIDYLIDDDWNYSFHIIGNKEILKKVDQAKLAEAVDVESIHSPIKIILLNIEDPIMGQIRKKLQEMNVALVTHLSENAIDITAKGINKFSTLRNVIGNQAYIAFGNDQNDIQLLENAATAYAVGEGINLDTVLNIDKKDIVRVIHSIK